MDPAPVADLGSRLFERSLPLIERIRFDAKSATGIDLRVCAKSPDFSPRVLTGDQVLAELVFETLAGKQFLPLCGVRHR